MKSKKQNTAVLSVILVGLIIVAYKILFTEPVDESLISESTVESEKIVRILREVESINFSAGSVSDPKINTLKSIETDLPVIPVGKTNPFSSAQD